MWYDVHRVRNIFRPHSIRPELRRSIDVREARLRQEAPELVIHLAAAAGVRPSIERPLFYEEVNVRGTMHLLEASRQAGEILGLTPGGLASLREEVQAAVRRDLAALPGF